MPCECGQADECDGEHATYYPLQDGGMCAVRPCSAPKRCRDCALLLAPGRSWYCTHCALAHISED